MDSGAEPVMVRKKGRGSGRRKREMGRKEEAGQPVSWMGKEEGGVSEREEGLTLAAVHGGVGG